MISAIRILNILMLMAYSWTIFTDICSGGGLGVLVKETIASSRWQGMEETAENRKAGKERMWILINTVGSAQHLLGMYIYKVIQ